MAVVASEGPRDVFGVCAKIHMIMRVDQTSRESLHWNKSTSSSVLHLSLSLPPLTGLVYYPGLYSLETVQSNRLFDYEQKTTTKIRSQQFCCSLCVDEIGLKKKKKKKKNKSRRNKKVFFTLRVSYLGPPYFPPPPRKW